MSTPIVTRGDDALTFTTSPTDVMRFWPAATRTRRMSHVEELAPGDGPPLHRHPWVTGSRCRRTHPGARGRGHLRGRSG